MDKFLIRRDVYDELIEKGYGKRDLSKLTKKQITDKNGHKRTVYVKNGEQPVTQKQTKTDELTPEKKARYEDMLEKVKAGPNENALSVKGKMLNKEAAIAHLEGKLGIKENTQSDKKSNSLDSFLDSLGWDERKRGAAIKSLTERKIKTKKGEMSPKDFVDTVVKDDGLNGVSRTRLDADGWSYILKQYDFDDMVLYQYAKFIKEKKDLEKFKKIYSGKTITNPIQIDYRLRDFAKVYKIEEDKIWKNVGGIKNLDNIKFSKDGENVILNYKNGEKAILNKDGKKTVSSAA